MRPGNSLYSTLGTTIFETMSRLASEHGAVNLGQGFPDDPGSEVLRRAAADAVLYGWNQYAPLMGLPVLRQAIAEHERRFYGLDLDWEREVMVTSGATEALAACFLALLSPGDEVVVIEPAYDSYAPVIRRAGGVVRYVTLRGPDWSLDLDELRAAFSPRTQAIVWNDPHNPSGRVFSRAEREAVAALVLEHDSYVIADEVYEHLLFDGLQHETLLAVPGLADRVLKIGSAGKTFSMTGWKVGMITGPAALVAAVGKAHQFLTFATPPNLQVAVAAGLGWSGAEIGLLAAEMQRRRDRLVRGLRALGIEVRQPSGTYFLNVETRSFGWRGDDLEFARQLVLRAGVASIPLSPFYGQEVENGLIRLCFAKQDAVIDLALERLARWGR